MVSERTAYYRGKPKGRFYERVDVRRLQTLLTYVRARVRGCGTFGAYERVDVRRSRRKRREKQAKR